MVTWLKSEVSCWVPGGGEDDEPGLEDDGPDVGMAVTSHIQVGDSLLTADMMFKAEWRRADSPGWLAQPGEILRMLEHWPLMLELGTARHRVGQSVHMVSTPTTQWCQPQQLCRC